jgi:ubiquinone biosynthesis protein
MTVEGVARRIHPDHDIWAAADPVVRRWIARELSPLSRLRRFAEEAEVAVRNLARLAQEPPLPTVVVEQRPEPPRFLWFALGALVAGLAFLAGAVFG